MRRFVWDFIVDKTKGGEWHFEFWKRLHIQFPVPPLIPLGEYHTDQPFFVIGNGKGWDANSYYISKMVPTKEPLIGNTLAVLCFGSRQGEPMFGESEEHQYPNWQLRLCVKWTDLLYWHFVARAFAAWNDIRINANSLACRQGLPTLPGDLNLIARINLFQTL